MAGDSTFSPARIPPDIREDRRAEERKGGLASFFCGSVKEGPGVLQEMPSKHPHSAFVSSKMIAILSAVSLDLMLQDK